VASMCADFSPPNVPYLLSRTARLSSVKKSQTRGILRIAYQLWIRLWNSSRRRTAILSTHSTRVYLNVKVTPAALVAVVSSLFGVRRVISREKVAFSGSIRGGFFATCLV